MLAGFAGNARWWIYACDGGKREMRHFKILIPLQLSATTHTLNGTLLWCSSPPFVYYVCIIIWQRQRQETTWKHFLVVSKLSSTRLPFFPLFRLNIKVVALQCNPDEREEINVCDVEMIVGWGSPEENEKKGNEKKKMKFHHSLGDVDAQSQQNVHSHRLS